MNAYRITKHNPEFRNSEGHYLRDDWIMVSDIGEKFSGEILTVKKYLEVENAYVETVRRFLRAAQITHLRIKTPEPKPDNDLIGIPQELKSEIGKRKRTFDEEEEISGPDIDWVIRLNLRGLFWCRLEGARHLYIHFGWDYYMYLGIIDDDFILPPFPTGMYVEPFKSPYNAENEHS